MKMAIFEVQFTIVYEPFGQPSYISYGKGNKHKRQSLTDVTELPFHKDK